MNTTPPSAAGQSARILAALQAGERLSPLPALDRFGCLRLGARIYDLRRAGHAIQARRVKTPGGKYVAQYYLP